MRLCSIKQNEFYLSTNGCITTVPAVHPMVTMTDFRKTSENSMLGESDLSKIMILVREC